MSKDTDSMPEQRWGGRVEPPVRLPASMTEYTCRRSLLCCRPPWRVWLGPGEAEAIRERVGASTDDETAEPLERRLAEAVQSRAGGARLLRQNDFGCAMLDRPSPGCTLRLVGGLDAMPLQCRNFPRSVVTTPTGTEVAFRLDCPTVAAMVVDDPRPFEWARAEAETWSWPPMGRVADVIRWTTHGTMALATFETLRQGWWSEFDRCHVDAEDDSSLPDVLAAMIDSPDDPTVKAGAELQGLIDVLASDATNLVLSFLARLPKRGIAYWEERESFMTLLRTPPVEKDLRSAAAECARELAAAAGLVLQMVGLHDGRPADEGIRRTAGQIGLAAWLSTVLRNTPGVSGSEAARDALNVAAHISSVTGLGTMVMVD
jgi:hypothetical protein